MFSQTRKVIIMVMLWTVSFVLLIAAVVADRPRDHLLIAWSLYLALGGAVVTLWYFGIHQTQRIEKRLEEELEEPLQRVEGLIETFVVSMENARAKRDSDGGVDRIH